MRLANKLLLIFIMFDCCGQNKVVNDLKNNFDLVGVWQSDRYDEAAAWPDTYQFFNDGKFIFNFSQYDGSKRIIRIFGKYRVEGEKIYLRIEFTEEATGGSLTRSTITSLSDTWELTDSRVELIKQHNEEEEIIRVNKCQDQYPKECLTFDNRKYFRMDKDPEKYK